MRGEGWTIKGDGLASKPRPAVIVQSDDCDDFDTLLVCLITSKESADKKTRVPIAPTATNGLRKRSWMMTEKILPIWKNELGEKVGLLSDGDIEKLNEALRTMLALC